eukprot:762933-Hanusia_phi.AAC.1
MPAFVILVPTSAPTTKCLVTQASECVKVDQTGEQTRGGEERREEQKKPQEAEESREEEKREEKAEESREEGEGEGEEAEGSGEEKRIGYEQQRSPIRQQITCIAIATCHELREDGSKALPLSSTRSETTVWTVSPSASFACRGTARSSQRSTFSREQLLLLLREPAAHKSERQVLSWTGERIEEAHHHAAAVGHDRVRSGALDRAQGLEPQRQPGPSSRSLCQSGGSEMGSGQQVCVLVLEAQGLGSGAAAAAGERRGGGRGVGRGRLLTALAVRAESSWIQAAAKKCRHERKLLVLVQEFRTGDVDEKEMVLLLVVVMMMENCCFIPHLIATLQIKQFYDTCIPECATDEDVYDSKRDLCRVG